MFGHVAIEFALCGLPKGFSREVPTMCFDGVARVSRAAAQLAFFVAVALDVYQGKAIWNVSIDSLFLNALPVPMLATGTSNAAQTIQMNLPLTIGGFFRALLHKGIPC